MVDLSWELIYNSPDHMTSRAKIVFFASFALLCSQKSLSQEYQTLSFGQVLHMARVVFVGKPDKPFMTREWTTGEQSGEKYRMQLTFYNYIVQEQIIGEKEKKLTRGQKLKVRAPNTFRDIDVAQIASQGGMEMPEYWEYKSPFTGQKGNIIRFDAKSLRIVYLSKDPLEILGEDQGKFIDQVKKRFAEKSAGQKK